MERKEFIKACGFSCLGLIVGSAILESCATSKVIEAKNNNDVIEIAIGEFTVMKGEKIKELKHLLVKTKRLEFPIVVFKNSDTSYDALLLACTHQANELNINGDILTCPAHGSEFTKTGEIISGPADKPLKSFKVLHDYMNIYIHLV